MNFSDFSQIVPNLRNEPLTAESSHMKMVPPERVRLMKEIDFNIVQPRTAAVLLLIYPKNNSVYFTLILRNSYKGVHSSQVALPGGKREDSDSNLRQTALRETWEEIGIVSEEIEIIKDLSAVYIPPSNFMVQPILGIAHNSLNFQPDSREVAEVIEVDLDDFLHDNTMIQVERQTSYANEMRVPAFQIGEHMVWGATAMILSEFKDIVNSVISR